MLEEQKLLEDLSDLIDDSLCLSDTRRFHFYDINEPIYVYAHLPEPHDVIKMNWSTIRSNVMGEYQESLSQMIKKAFQQGPNIDIKVPFLFDEMYLFLVRGNLSTDFNCIIGVMIDITHHQQLSQKSQEKKKQAEEALNAKSKFLANMSHEIRTPLSGMSGLLDLIESTDIPHDVRDLLTVIRFSFSRLLEVLNDALDLAKIEQRKMQPSFVKFDLVDRLIPIIRANTFYLTISQVDFRTTIHSNTPIAVYGEPHFFQRVVSNCLSCALKAFGGGDLTKSSLTFIHFDCCYENNQLILKIDSDAIHLSNSEIESIYEPFPLMNLPHTCPGATIRLAKEMIEMIKGSIIIQNIDLKPNRGTQIILNFPFESRKQFIPPSLPHSSILTTFPEIISKHIHPTFFTAFNTEFKVDPKTLPQCIICNPDEEEHFSKLYPSIPICLISSQKIESNNQLMSLAEFGLQFPSFFSQFLNNVPESQNNTIIPPNFKLIAAEDNRTIQFILKKLFTNLKLDFSIVGNGEEVVKILSEQENSYNLVLMDQEMPIMGGIEATKAIRQLNNKNRDIPIFSMTANTDKTESDECIQAGMNKFLSKPITKEVLLNSIQEALTFPFNKNSN